MLTKRPAAVIYVRNSANKRQASYAKRAEILKSDGLKIIDWLEAETTGPKTASCSS